MPKDNLHDFSPPVGTKASRRRSALDADVASLALLGCVMREMRRGVLSGVIAGRAAAFAVVVPDGFELIDAEIVMAVMLDEAVEGNRYCTIRARDADTKNKEVWEDGNYGRLNLRTFVGTRRRNRHVVLLGHARHFDALDPRVAALLEGTVVVPDQPSLEILRAAMGVAFGLPVSEQDAERAMPAGWGAWSKLLDPRRGLSKSLQDLEAVVGMAREEIAALKQSKPKAKPEAPKAVGDPLEGVPSLEEMHGLGEAKEWAFDLIRDLHDYQEDRIGWSEVDRGALLVSPPGCGKTSFARALAKSAGAPLFSHSVARWMSPSGKEGSFSECANLMRQAFDSAMAAANAAGAAIMFVDEVDTIGNREALAQDRNGRWMSDFCNLFLELLDGFEGREGVVVVGATNHADHVDPAVRRPGRLDRTIWIPMPDGPARVGILKWHLKDSASGLDLEFLADRTEGMSGADLEMVARTARRTARRGNRAVTLDDLAAELPEVLRVPDWAYWKTCVHEAGHALVIHRMGIVPIEHVIAKRTVVLAGSGGQAGGVRVAEKHRIAGQQTRADMEAYVASMLAGTAAEEVILGVRSGGAGGTEESDLYHATLEAVRIHASFGLGGGLAYQTGVDADRCMATLRLNPVLLRAVEETLAQCMAAAKAMVDAERDAVLALAGALRDAGRLSGDEAMAILDAQPCLRLVV